MSEFKWQHFDGEQWPITNEDGLVAVVFTDAKAITDFLNKRMSRNEEVENLARALRDRRANRRTPMTDNEWAQAKRLFPTSYKILLEDAAQMIEDGECE